MWPCSKPALFQSIPHLLIPRDKHAHWKMCTDGGADSLPRHCFTNHTEQARCKASIKYGDKVQTAPEQPKTLSTTVTCEKDVCSYFRTLLQKKLEKKFFLEAPGPESKQWQSEPETVSTSINSWSQEFQNIASAASEPVLGASCLREVPVVYRLGNGMFPAHALPLRGHEDKIQVLVVKDCFVLLTDTNFIANFKTNHRY